jgi:hypothetical protein
MDLRRLRAADWATGLFGAALVGLLWAPWFTHTGSVSLFLNRDHPPRWAGGTAWQSMAVNDVILFIAGVLGIWLLVATATYSTAAVPLAAAAFTLFAGLLASVLALYRLAFPPDLGPGGTGRAFGVWLGTAAAIGMTVSAAVSMRDERRTSAPEVPITDLPAPRVGGEPSGA